MSFMEEANWIFFLPKFPVPEGFRVDSTLPNIYLSNEILITENSIKC